MRGVSKDGHKRVRRSFETRRRGRSSGGGWNRGEKSNIRSEINEFVEQNAGLGQHAFDLVDRI